MTAKAGSKHSAFDFELVCESISAVTCLSYEFVSKVLYVCLQDCSLLSFDCTVGFQQLERTANFTKRPVVQMDTLPDRLQVYLQSDGSLSMNQNKTVVKNCSCYSLLDQSASWRVDLAVVVKKKLSMFAYDAKQRQFFPTRNFELVDVPRSIVMASSNRVVLVFRREYAILETENGAVFEVFPVGSRSCAVAVTQDSIIFARENNIGVTCGFDGKVIRKHGFVWSEPPSRLLYSAPFVLSVEPQGMEVHAELDGRMVQMIPISSADCCTASPAGCDTVFAFSEQTNSIWRLSKVPLEEQLNNMLRHFKFEEALLFCDYLQTDREAWKRRVHEEFGFFLVNSQRRFEEAIMHFTSAETDPQKVIAQFNLDSETLDPQAVSALEAYLLQCRLMGATDLDDAILRCLRRGTDPVDLARLKEFICDPQNACSVELVEAVTGQKSLFRDLIVFYGRRSLLDKAVQKLGETSMDLVADVADFVGQFSLAGHDGLIVVVLASVLVLGGILSAPPHGLSIPWLAHAVQSGKRFDLERSGLDVHFSRIFCSSSTLLTDSGRIDTVRAMLASVPEFLRAFAEFYVFRSGSTYADLHNDLLRLCLQAAQADATKRPELQHFLQVSECYDARKVLSMFPRDSLHEERALVYSRLDAHDEVLRIYVRLGRWDLLEDYCASKNIFDMAVQILLDPVNYSKENLRYCVEMLAAQFRDSSLPSVSPADILRYIPPDARLQDVLPYVESVFGQYSTRLKYLSVVSSLSRGEQQRLRVLHVAEHCRFVLITQDRTCAVCGKRIGSSVFAVYPSNRVVHVGCEKHDPERERNLRMTSEAVRRHNAAEDSSR